MKEVFIVTHGAYSGYTIDAVFSTRYRANKFRDAMNKTYPFDVSGAINDMYRYRVERWQVDWEHDDLNVAHSQPGR